MPDEPAEQTISEGEQPTAVDQSTPAPQDEPAALNQTKEPKRNNWLAFFWQGKVAPAFWTIASLVSMTVNAVLLIVLILVGRQLFVLKGLVEDGLIGGLYGNFVKMDEASIVTSIQVEDTILVQDTIPVVFDLPLKQQTQVILNTATYIPNTAVYLNGVPIYTTVVLPEGTPLDITLDLVVPVSQTLPVVLNVPVSLNVPVNIPLQQTELHEPFVGLQSVLRPYRTMLGDLPNSWQQTPICGDPPNTLCRWLFDLK